MKCLDLFPLVHYTEFMTNENITEINLKKCIRELSKFPLLLSFRMKNIDWITFFSIGTSNGEINLHDWNEIIKGSGSSMIDEFVKYNQYKKFCKNKTNVNTKDWLYEEVGHSVIILDILIGQENEIYLKIKNSWGSNSGRNGHYVVPIAIFERFSIYSVGFHFHEIPLQIKGVLTENYIDYVNSSYRYSTRTSNSLKPNILKNDLEELNLFIKCPNSDQRIPLSTFNNF